MSTLPIPIVTLPDTTGFKTNYFAIKIQNETFLLRGLNATDIFNISGKSSEEHIDFTVTEKGSIKAKGIIYWSEYFKGAIWHPEYYEINNLSRFLYSPIGWLSAGDFIRDKHYEVYLDDIASERIIKTIVEADKRSRAFQSFLENSLMSFKKMAEASGARVTIGPWTSRQNIFTEWQPGIFLLRQ